MKTKVCIILVCLIGMASSVYATVYTGSLGPELTYTLDSGTGHVVIEGRGAMTSRKGSLLSARTLSTGAITCNRLFCRTA